MDREKPRQRIAILGGGITGLTAAYTIARARQGGAPVEEFLIEAGERLGGVIHTEDAEGFVVEAGPDSFLAEKPEAAALCRELGLGSSLLGSDDHARRHYVLHRSRLVLLPEGLQLFVPARPWSVLRTPLLSWRSKLAIIGETFRPSPSGNLTGRSAQRDAPRNSIEAGHGSPPPAGPRLQGADESVASFVRRHFGSEMLENVADPLLAGIFGGDSACLSVRSVLPRFQEMERKYGSLIRGVFKEREQQRGGAGFKPAPTALPLFMTLNGGLGALVGELRKHFEDSRVHLGQRVIAIEPATRGIAVAQGRAVRDPEERGVSPPPPAARSAARQYEIRCEVKGPAPGKRRYSADAIILALPAYECSRMLSPLDGALAEGLSSIPYSSALTVALGYGPRVASELPPGFGFLVPQKEKRRLLACTFVHGKFSHRAPPGQALLRCFLGGSRDPEILDLPDGRIVSIVLRELEAILHLSATPLFYRIYRWPASMPQYVLGHEERVRAINERLENLAGIYLAGNAYSGIGIPDCIRSGEAAAERALEDLCR